MKIDPYNLELYRFKLDAFFSETQCIFAVTAEVCNLCNMHCGTLKCVSIATLTFLGHMTSSVT